MRAADLQRVAAIDAADPSPWSYGQMASELGQESGWQLVAVPLGQDDLVCGFICGRIAAGEAELFKIAVDVECRRRGVASLLLASSIELLAVRGVQRIFLELRTANLGAKALYERFGFQEVGVRKNYYLIPPDNALIMEKVIVEGVSS